MDGCVTKKHFHLIESAIHEMKIEYTPMKMFWKRKNTIFCAFIVNIGPKNKRNRLKMKKEMREKSFKG